MKRFPVPVWFDSRLLLILCSVLGFSSAAPGQSVAKEVPVYRFVGGSITVKVVEFDAARENLVKAARQQGAELLEAHTDVTPEGRKHGFIRLRFPADRLSEVLSAIRGQGTLYAERIATTDNTSVYETLGRRAERLRQHQTRLDSILQNGRRLRGSDILYVQERLFRAGVDESLLEQERADLSRRTAISTLQVAFFEPLPIRKRDIARRDLMAHFNNARNNAVDALLNLAGRATTAAAYALVFAPIYLPVGLAAFFVLRLLWLRGKPLLLHLFRLTGEVVLPLRLLYRKWRNRTVMAAPTPEAVGVEAV